jgi:hypothetical protein
VVPKIRVAQRTSLEDFWKLLPEGTEEALLGLEYDGRKGEQTVEVPQGVGRVTTWLDECSEGADRGGYVCWAKLHDVLDYNNQPVVLEADTDGSCFFFADRMGVLL